MPQPTPTGRTLGSLWRLRPYVRPYRRQLTVMTVAALLGVGASIVVPLVTKAVIDGPVAHGQRGRLVVLGLLAVLLGIAEGGLVFVRRWVQSEATVSIETALRRDLYARLQSLPPGFHDQWQSGQLLSRATVDLSAIRRFVGFGLVFLVVNSATFVVVVTLLVRLDLPLGLFVAATAAPVVVLSARFEQRYAAASRAVQDRQGDLTTVVEEATAGIRVIKAYGRQRHVAGRFAALADAVYRGQVRKARLQASFWAALDLIPNATLAVVLLVGALAVGHHQLSIGGLVAFIALVLQLVWPVESLGYILASGQEAATAADRVFELLDTEPAVRDRPGARRHPAVRGRLSFERVGFRFPGADRPVLAGVDLTLEPGETVALVGPTGAGKTTLVSLVPRLADVTAGAVRLDGVDVRDLPLSQLRAVVASAFDEPTLFSVSVWDNVTLGVPDASEEQVHEALELAQAQFAFDLPAGLGTRIGEQGVTLSGGQRQRLALARAVLGRPAVMVLDDPLSALDVTTEAVVERALRRVLAGTTALVVAQRPSTVALADRVALLADGRIAAVGTHRELLAGCPPYRALLAPPPATAEPTAVRHCPAGSGRPAPVGSGAAARSRPAVAP